MEKGFKIRIPNPVNDLQKHEVEIRVPIVIDGIQVKELSMKKTIHLSDLREMIKEFFFNNAEWVPTFEGAGKASDLFKFFVDGYRVTNDEINSLELSARIEATEAKIKFVQSEAFREILTKQLREQSEEAVQEELRKLKEWLSIMKGEKPKADSEGIPHRETYPGPGHSEDL